MGPRQWSMWSGEFLSGDPVVYQERDAFVTSAKPWLVADGCVPIRFTDDEGIKIVSAANLTRKTKPAVCLYEDSFKVVHIRRGEEIQITDKFTARVTCLRVGKAEDSDVLRNLLGSTLFESLQPILSRFKILPIIQ